MAMQVLFAFARCGHHVKCITLVHFQGRKNLEVGRREEQGCKAHSIPAECAISYYRVL